jgi:hypothetical protein
MTMHDDQIDDLIRVLHIPPDQAKRLEEALQAGWKLETDPQRIAARYRDLDLADQVPRAIMYCDIGALLGILFSPPRRTNTKHA